MEQPLFAQIGLRQNKITPGKQLDAFLVYLRESLEAQLQCDADRLPFYRLALGLGPILVKWSTLIGRMWSVHAPQLCEWARLSVPNRKNGKGKASIQ